MKHHGRTIHVESSRQRKEVREHSEKEIETEREQFGNKSVKQKSTEK